MMFAVQTHVLSASLKKIIKYFNNIHIREKIPIRVVSLISKQLN